jgi:catechol 2,3-dioxygenase-like lactoylglutathione lyase family enzyme
MPALRIQVVSVPVADQDQAKAFYLEKLGFEEVSDAPYAQGMRWVEVRPPGSPTSFTLVTWFPSMPAGSLQGVVLETPDVQEAYRELTSRGLHLSHEPRQEFWGTFTTFSDPDGNGFVLAQSAPRNFT